MRPAVKLSCVILTMGDRPQELRRAVEGVLHQHDVDVEVVVVGNGAPLPDLPDEVITLPLPENLGIPGGRNRGVQACSGDVILFLDDDGWYPSPRLAVHVSEAFATDPTLGVISFRIRDPQGGPGHRRHVPRLRAGDPARSSDVTTFLGGACAVRRQAYDEAGGLPDGFFYAHEETDLAWQVIDHGYRIRYDAEAVMYHPAVKPTRHSGFYRMNARNRVWLARRNLPAPLIPVYLGIWVALTLLRERRREALRAWFSGFAEGWREDAGPRRPISWRTVWRMSRTGRPPVI